VAGIRPPPCCAFAVSEDRAVIIAQRMLVLLNKSQPIEIPIRIHAPERAKVDWICRFEIGWPGGTAERWGAGSDAVQALLIALQMIGAEIYASDHHRSGELSWFAPGRGYGFPVSGNIRDLLVGDDAEYF
jgi:hypothetical protein